jgi:zinc protease
MTSRSTRSTGWRRSGIPVERLVIVRHDKPGVTLPDEASLSAALKAGPSATLTAYVDRIASSTLLDTLPEPARVVKTSSRDAIGVTEWELANGVKVVLKPTTFKQDEIMFRAFSPGGTSQASDADFVPASGDAGRRRGRTRQVQQRGSAPVLTGKIASADATIGEPRKDRRHASPKDLETMFQLIYMRFTQPRADPVIFATQTSQLKTLMANQANTPAFAFAAAMAEIMGQNHPRRRLPTAAMIDEWNLEKSMAFYKDRFGDASDFTFVFVGNIDPAVMKPLAERYLGSLPSLRRKEAGQDVGVRSPKGTITKQVVKGLEPKSQAAIVYTGPFDFTAEQRVTLRAMTEILQTRLLETIREDLGGTYSITARSSQ